MSLGHPRWQDGSKNGAKQIASWSHRVAGREPRHSERGPKVAVEGGGTASQGPRPTSLGWTEASAVRSHKRSFPRCSDSHLIGGTPVFGRRARRERTLVRSRQRRSPQRDRGVGALMGCPVGSASTIRKAATTPSADPRRRRRTWSGTLVSRLRPRERVRLRSEAAHRRRRTGPRAFGALSCARAEIGGSASFRAASRKGRRPVKRCVPVCFVLSLEKAR